MSSKKPRNPKLTPEMLALIENDAPDCGKEFNQYICIMKHIAAKNREVKGFEHGPCAYCPVVLKFLGRVTKPAEKPAPAAMPKITQEELETMTTETIQAPKKEKSEKYQKICITPDCSNTVKAHGKTGRCHSCQAKVNAKLAHEARKNKKPAPRTDEKKTWNGQASQPGYAIVGTYPEPAADTIHASQPPEKLVIHIEESDVCRRAINQYGILRQMA
ncbi:MAG: hypothetical protein PHV05_13350, partial [Candidatus Riflebacteria bacterium]|nr:hypothetical protein [Candidatus Riflebacteria bacterium]